MEAYGPPAGIIFGPNLTLNTTAGLGLFGMGAPAPQRQPTWARAIWPSSLTAQQQMWIYQLKGEVAAGFIINGLGPNATITDIVAASFKANKSVETERGLALGDSFTQVLVNYGYPPLLQPFAGQAGAVRAAASARALQAEGAPSFGRAGQPMQRDASQDWRNRGAGGRGALAPLSPTAGAQGSSTVVVVNQQPVTFTKNCVILYDGIALTLYDFKVVRIHITQ
jgi:hypothetical protein